MAQQRNPFHLDQAGADEILAHEPVEEVSKACNLDPRDHVHLFRVGEEATGLAARGVLAVHEGGTTTKVFLAAPELRQIASALLNVADAIDGRTPLVFFDPSAPGADEPER